MSSLRDMPSRRLAPIVVLCAVVTVAAAALAVKAPSHQGSTRFAVIGDTGTGDKYQNAIAQVLIRSHEVFPFTFVIMMGDNSMGQSVHRTMRTNSRSRTRRCSTPTCRFTRRSATTTIRISDCTSRST